MNELTNDEIFAVWDRVNHMTSSRPINFYNAIIEALNARKPDAWRQYQNSGVQDGQGWWAYSTKRPESGGEPLYLSAAGQALRNTTEKTETSSTTPAPVAPPNAAAHK